MIFMNDNDGRSMGFECQERYSKATNNSGQLFNFGGRSLSDKTFITRAMKKKKKRYSIVIQ